MDEQRVDAERRGLRRAGHRLRLVGELVQRRHQRGACGKRRTVLLVGKGDGDLGRLAQRRQQAPLIAGRLAGLVEEDGSSAPGVRRRPQRLDRRHGEPVRVAHPKLVAQLGVGGEQRRQVAEVGGGLERLRPRLQRRRLEAGGLQLVEQPLEGDREARPGGGAPQRSQPAVPRRDPGRDGGEALCRRQLAPGRRPARPGDLAEQVGEGQRRAAERRAVGAEAALEAEDVVEGRQDQHRIAVERRAEQRLDPVGATGVGGSVDQLHRHRRN